MSLFIAEKPATLDSERAKVINIYVWVYMHIYYKYVYRLAYIYKKVQRAQKRSR